MSETNRQLHQALILDHAERKVGEGTLTEPDASYFERNPVCGDEITLEISWDDKSQRINNIAWSGEGCAMSRASASMLSEMVVQRDVASIEEIAAELREMVNSRGTVSGNEEVLGDAIAFQGVSHVVMRIKCVLLPWVALEKCLHHVGAL